MSGSLIPLMDYDKKRFNTSDVITPSINITEFVKVYKKKTFYSNIKFHVNNTTEANFGDNISFSIVRYCDLISNPIISLDLPLIYASNDTILYWTYGIGYALLENVEIIIGGFKILNYTGEWLNIWHETHFKDEKRREYDNLVGKFAGDGHQDGCIRTDIPTNPKYPNISMKLYIPLYTWFNDIYKPLILVALQYYDVKINIKLRNLEDLVNIKYNDIPTNPINPPNKLICETKQMKINLLMENNIYLDTELRRLLCEGNHQQLIKQIKMYEFDVNNVDNSVNIDISCDINEIYFAHRTIEHEQSGLKTCNIGNRWLNFGNNLNSIGHIYEDDTFNTCKINYSKFDVITNEARLFRMYDNHNNTPRIFNRVIPDSNKYFQYIYNYCLCSNPMSDDEITSYLPFRCNIELCIKYFENNNIIQKYKLLVFVVSPNILVYSGGMCCVKYCS